MQESNDDEYKLFPILRGDSIGVDGEFSGSVLVARNSDDLHRNWNEYDIVALHENLHDFLSESPGEIDQLFQNVMVVISEFGEPLSEFAAIAYARERMAVVNVPDACHVLETDMQISVVTNESQGDIYFIR